MSLRLRAAAAVLVLAGAGTTAGCSALNPPACADWVDLADAQAMFDEAELVVEGVVGPEDGTVRFETGDGVRHPIAVESVHKGEATGTIEAASPRDYCVADPPAPAEDPLHEGERVLLFLHRGPDGAWSVLTPWDGVLPFEEGAEPPFSSGA